jgi:PAS domain S-box-containing protein
MIEIAPGISIGEQAGSMSKVTGPTDDAQVLARLVDSITDYAIFMLDADGFVTTWNTGAERIKQYAREEIIGAHFSRFFTEEDKMRGLPRHALETARSTGRFESEGLRVRRDGTRFMALAILDAIRDESGQVIGFAKITRDITERHAAQQELLESESRFRLLVEGVTDYAIYMLDPSGVVTNWNAGAERIKGYRADEIIGRHFSLFFPIEDRAAGIPMRNLDIAAREGRFEAEARRVRKDGSEFWAHIIVDAIKNHEGEIIGFAKVTRDITERRAAQHALRESERQFSLLVKGVVDYAIYLLDPNGIITSWNAGAEKIKGYSADDVIGRHFSIFYTEPERRAGLPARALHKARTEQKFEAEGWRVRKDGSHFWANVVIDPIHDDNGNFIGFAKITRDITDRREAQTTLAAAQAQLAHAQKMEALGQLTGGVAHDFNNLLMVIQGQTQLLARRLKGNKEVLPALEALQAATRRGAALTRQLLTFARRQPSNPELIALRDQIEPLKAMLSNALRDNVTLSLSMPRELWPIHVDVAEFELALLNLVVNARDAMTRGGEISVVAENAHMEPGKLRDGLAGDYVTVTVSDAGEGIPADILPKVFDPFFTTKDGDRGSGLGLAQVFGFARHSGGDVLIRSELGKGTQVSIFLPRAAKDLVRDAGRAIEESAPAGAGHILLVEDNPDVSAVTAQLLDQLGYTVTSCGNAAAALAALENGSFDLVISDIVMSGALDGIGLAERIRQTWPHLPVLLATGYSNAAERAGETFPTLRKPYEMADLSRAVANLLVRRNADAAANVVPLRAARKEKSEG